MIFLVIQMHNFKVALPSEVLYIQSFTYAF